MEEPPSPNFSIGWCVLIAFSFNKKSDTIYGFLKNSSFGYGRILLKSIKQSDFDLISETPYKFDFLPEKSICESRFRKIFLVGHYHPFISLLL